MTDDPPSGVSVLFFQVSLTSATLTPAAGSGSTSLVSLVENPIQIDVTQLQALSAFLANENVPAGTYSSLSLTFANPQLVILNSSDALWAAPARWAPSAPSRPPSTIQQRQLHRRSIPARGDKPDSARPADRFSSEHHHPVRPVGEPGSRRTASPFRSRLGLLQPACASLRLCRGHS